MSDALRGVMWSFASHSSCWVNRITSLNLCARFIWRCFTVAVVAMSLRAFYDRTLIVEALFYTESYFRIQYVLLYNKCIVWRKLNKCCLKTVGWFPCLCLYYYSMGFFFFLMMTFDLNYNTRFRKRECYWASKCFKQKRPSWKKVLCKILLFATVFVLQPFKVDALWKST